MKVKNLMYNGRAVANQFVITDYENTNNKIVFQSYNSTIIEIDYANDIIKVYPDYNYSRTTIKYRNEFMHQIGLCDMDNTKGFEYYLKLGAIANFEILKVS